MPIKNELHAWVLSCMLGAITAGIIYLFDYRIAITAVCVSSGAVGSMLYENSLKGFVSGVIFGALGTVTFLAIGLLVAVL